MAGCSLTWPESISMTSILSSPPIPPATCAAEAVSATSFHSSAYSLCSLPAPNRHLASTEQAWKNARQVAGEWSCGFLTAVLRGEGDVVAGTDALEDD